MTDTPFNTPELREDCAQKLLAGQGRAQPLTAFLGLDGFVDEIVHVVDKRERADSYHRLPTISRLAERIAAAASRSTNIELVPQRTKIGGNGPILANALASLDVGVTYLGALGFPQLHPVFQQFAERAEVHSIAEAAHTDALEFEDGKLLLGKTLSLEELTWDVIQQRFGRERFLEKFSTADLVGFVNWTMIPSMSEVWEVLLAELCPLLTGPRRWIFFDLADPEKRTARDLLHALELVEQFGHRFKVVLGMNEKEACHIAQVLGRKGSARDPDALATLAVEMHQRLRIETLTIHPVSYAVAVTGDRVSRVEGPAVLKPMITTGGGDHYNGGFCLGKLLELDDAQCVLLGVATSGFYVRTGLPPTRADLVGMLRNWPERERERERVCR
jgi:hypothetical protein